MPSPSPPRRASAPAPARRNPHWHVETQDGKAFTPRAYSTGLTQDEAVRQVLNAFRRARGNMDGADVFFIAGTGSGKSLVALNVAARVGGRALIVTPTVNLQDQYEEVGENLLVPRPDGLPLKVASVKGKRRYPCRHEGGTVADARTCVRGPKDKDAKWRKACECPYWAPTMTAMGYHGLLGSREDMFQTEPLTERQKEFLEDLDARGAKGYKGIDDEEYVHVGPRGCGYFDAHHAFAAADVTVLSNRKWEVETEIGRKPRVDLEVFDEADGFLDELFEEKRLTVEGLQQLLARIAFAAKCLSLPEDVLRDDARFGETDPNPHRLPDPEGWLALLSLVRRLGTFEKPDDFSDEKTWHALEAAPVMLKQWPKMAVDRLRTQFPRTPWVTPLVDELLVGQGIQDEDENIIAKVKNFVENKDSLIVSYDETGVYFTFENLTAPLRRMTEKSAPLRLWMSATFPSADILRQVYGFRNPVIVHGEPRFQGTLRVVTSADAPKVTHKTWQDAETRRAFARALDDVFRRVPEGERTIVVVHGKKRIEEIADISPVAKWITREIEDDGERHEHRLELFMQGERPALASTRIARGVDFADERARNIVLIKDPLPNLRSRRFQVLEKKWNKGLLFMYADDIANRTLAQMVGRGLRNPEDWARMWVLDQRIHERLARITHDKARVVDEPAPPVVRSLESVKKQLPPPTGPLPSEMEPSADAPGGRTGRGRSKSKNARRRRRT